MVQGLGALAWYLVGSFTVAKAAVAGRYLELRLDGSVPSTCAIQSRFNGLVYAIAYDANWIYAGGAFTAYAGQPAKRIAKISRVNCALDTTFSPAAPAANCFDNVVYSPAVDSGSVYAGGCFTAYRAVSGSAYYFAKLDATTGTLDTIFGPNGFGNNGFNGPVQSIVVDSGFIYAGGSFGFYKNTAANKIAKISLAGVKDTTFSPNSGANGFTGGIVNALVIDGGYLYAGGSFIDCRSATNSARNLAKLSLADGTLDPIFGPAGASSNGVDGQGYAPSAAGGNLYVGGEFPSYQGAADSANKIAKVRSSDGVLDTTFYPPGPVGTNGFNFRVYAVAATSSALYVGGQFTLYRGQSANRIVKLDLNTTFSPAGATANGFDNAVRSLALAGGALYVGGDFGQ